MLEWWFSGGPRGKKNEDIVFVYGKGAEIIQWRTVAADPKIITGGEGTKIVIESIKDGAAQTVTDSKGVFKVTDTGGKVLGNHIDIFVGEMFHKDVEVMSNKIPNVTNTRVGVIKP